MPTFFFDKPYRLIWSVLGGTHLVLQSTFFFDKPYRLIWWAPGETHLVLQSGLARKRTTLPDPSLEYLPTNARGWTNHLLWPTM